MLLCDAAQEIGGKLYILGGGWTVRQVEPQALMAIALKLAVGWNEANEPLDFELRLVTQDGHPVDPGEGPIVINGRAEVGRPPGVTPGTELDAALALTVGLPLGAGSYRWEFDVNGQRLAQEPFVVKAPPMGAR
jgi:hypothetical protein